MNTQSSGAITTNWLSSTLILGSSNLSAFATIEELPSCECTFSPRTHSDRIVKELELRPDLPGIILLENGKVGMVSRNAILESLSRPYGTELFLQRPILFLSSAFNNPPFILPGETRIDEAVQLVLKRSPKELYEPLVITLKDGSYRLLDIHLLLMAQSQLLANANRFIRKQVETGRALSNILDIRDVMHRILRQLAEMIPYEQAAIALIGPDGFQQFTMVDHSGELLPNTGRDALHDPKINSYLYQTRLPMLLMDVQNSPEKQKSEFFTNIRSWIGFPFAYAEKIACVISISRMTKKTGTLNKISNHESFNSSDLDLIASLATTFSAAIRNAQLHSELQLLAVTDPLTEIYNRRGFFELAQIEFERIQKYRRTLSILMIDIDLFKRINDSFGHLIGDQVLKSVASICKNHVRENDFVGRFGGEEFIILLPELDLDSVRMIAERLRHKISQMRTITDKGIITFTVSIGVANFNPDCKSLDMLLQQADEALYIAKQNGRNRIEVWSPENIHLPEHPSPAGMMAYPPRDDWRNTEFIQPVPSMADEFLSCEKSDQESIIQGTILGWVHALAMRDNDTLIHAQNAAEITTTLCRMFGFQEKYLTHIYRGALLHDIGKLATPDHILKKTGRLTDEEWTEMCKHPENGRQFLQGISFLKPALNIPWCHHEKWDGSGYPRKLRGAEIPLEARIFAIVDVWDALNSNRSYRQAWGRQRIFDYLQAQSGVHFDPQILPSALEFLRKQEAPSSNKRGIAQNFLFSNLFENVQLSN